MGAKIILIVTIIFAIGFAMEFPDSACHDKKCKRHESNCVSNEEEIQLFPDSACTSSSCHGDSTNCHYNNFIENLPDETKNAALHLLTKYTYDELESMLINLQDQQLI